MKKYVYEYWLANIHGIGSKTIFKLLDLTGGSAKDLFFCRQEIIDGAGILRKGQLYAFLQSRITKQVHKEYEKLAAQGIDFIPFTSSEYPKRLKNIPDPPFGLYVKGKLPREDRPCVAVIGARLCSSYGKDMARMFGNRLGIEDIQVISGLARGVDSIGQLAAMEAGGESYGVLGCGVDICYPAENQSIYNQAVVQGGIISEYSIHTNPKASYFPPRNRIISGLSDALLVIEAKEKSGTSITVDMALEQGRDVYALPGRVTDALSFGCHKLIKQGAEIVISAQDFAQEILQNFYSISGDMSGSTQEKTRHVPFGKIMQSSFREMEYHVSENMENMENMRLHGMEQQVYSALEADLKTIDCIYEKVKETIECDVREVMQSLASLQIKGMVEKEGGSYRVPWKNSCV